MSTCPICKEVLDQPIQTRCPTPHIVCCQLPFICLWDLWIPLPSLQNCNWKSSGVHWTSSFCSMNYTIRTRFSMPYMHTYYKTTSAATASRELQIKPRDNTHTKWNPSARSSFSYPTTPPPPSSDTPTSTCSSTCSSWTCSCISTTYRTWSCYYLCRATDSTTTTTYPTGSIIMHPLKRSQIVYQSSVPITVSGRDNHSPKNRWPGRDILNVEWYMFIIFVFLMTLHFKTWHMIIIWIFTHWNWLKDPGPGKHLMRCKKKTVRKRSKVVSETRTAVSGGAAGT